MRACSCPTGMNGNLCSPLGVLSPAVFLPEVEGTVPLGQLASALAHGQVTARTRTHACMPARVAACE